MPSFNINSGFGQLTANRLQAKVAGAVFVVGKAALANRGRYTEIFGVSPAGKVTYSATIAGAVSNCTANGADTIYVLPGHTETISAAAGIALATAGVSIVGLGTGSNRPTITFDTATTATLTITAANVSIENFIFTQAFDAIVSPIVISGAGCTLRNCYFMTADATYQAVQMILTEATASGLTIENCRFVGTVDAGSTCAVTLVGGDNIRIVDNDFIGAYTTTVGAIRAITTLTTNVVIRRNTIVNRTASATKGITLLTGSTGVIAENRFGIGSGAAPITADASWWAGNWSAAAVATNGTLV